jgi:formate/nitrite transporter FocA (FNT family)
MPHFKGIHAKYFYRLFFFTLFASFGIDTEHSTANIFKNLFQVHFRQYTAYSEKRQNNSFAAIHTVKLSIFTENAKKYGVFFSDNAVFANIR